MTRCFCPVVFREKYANESTIPTWTKLRYFHFVQLQSIIQMDCGTKRILCPKKDFGKGSAFTPVFEN
jgi:hypothetical protein